MKNKKVVILLSAACLIIILSICIYVFVDSKNSVFEDTNIADNSNTLEKLGNLNYYTDDTIYTDINNESVNIPKDYAISTRKGENIIKDGLVIVDKNLNEFVYIPNGKFFVSRFEIGTETSTVGQDINKETLHSKQNMFPIAQISNLDLTNIPTSKDYEEIMKFTNINCSNITLDMLKEKIEPAKRTGTFKSQYIKNIANLNDNLFEMSKDNEIYGYNSKLKVDNLNTSFITTRFIIK